MIEITKEDCALCPSCKKVLYTTTTELFYTPTALLGDSVPVDGDFTCCWFCALILVFREKECQLTLVKSTQEDEDEFKLLEPAVYGKIGFFKHTLFPRKRNKE